MARVGALTSFTASTTAKAAEVNANFDEIKTAVNTYAVWTDYAQTISVTHAWTASQTFTGGWTAAAACTISSGGIAVTGNSTITGTLGGVTTLTCTTVTATNLGGTLTTAAQPNITSVGTLTSLAISGAFTPVSVEVSQPEATGPALTFNPSSGNAQVHVKNSTILTFDNVAETKRLLKLDFNTQRVSFAETAGTDVILGAAVVATNATAGFPFLPTCSGAATGSLDLARAGAIVLDTTNNRLYCYNGSAWKYAALT